MELQKQYASLEQVAECATYLTCCLDGAGKTNESGYHRTFKLTLFQSLYSVFPSMTWCFPKVWVAGLLCWQSRNPSGRYLERAEYQGLVYQC